MGFFMQNKQNQKKVEQFVLILYSIYSVNLCIHAIRRGMSFWILGFMLATVIVGWVIFLGKYKNFRARAGFITVMIQIDVILYAISSEDRSAMIPIFMVLTILVAFYGFVEHLWLTLISAFFILFYHGIFTDTFELASTETLLRLLPQAANIFCMELVLYTWLKNRNENNAQIYEMIEALMEAERSKDDFLANVSHEIRTPVNTICGMSEMVLREHDPSKVREEVFDIRDAGHNLMSLVTDILDFSQLQQGKMNLEEEVYDITSTINDIINMAMARKEDKPIELIVDCAADIPSKLLGDEKKIRRVIMNLLDNAIKFTNEGGVIIDISARKENYGINLCVSVKDTGIGISEENLEKLFESFSQVDTRRNRQKGGIGLGLAISKALVMKMGGTLTVRSRPGKGSSFRFVVPQKVLKEEHIVELEHREDLNIAAYFDMEQFDMMAIRDEYTRLIAHMVQQLRVRCHTCRNLAELKRRENIEPFTHIFISLEEYQEDEAYFEKLAKHTKVIAVIERQNEKYIVSPDMIRLYKPFYILPVVSILNGSTDAEGGMQIVRPGKFIAPNVHVLVVDDNRMNIRVIEGLLNEYQIKVSYATSGQEALKVIEHMHYDFVFMDHMMPEMDGVETLHRIRNKAGNYYQRVPIIALTANAAPGNREIFLDEGFNDFVAKPVETSVLERVLHRNLPEEKVIWLEKGKNVPKKSKEDITQIGHVQVKEAADINDFEVGDLDVGQGMLYCGGKEKYLNVLKAYWEEGKAHCQLLEDLYKKQDWKNYTIKVHALKSTMHSIGANLLSEMAKALEMAGKKGDSSYILQHHEDMVKEHNRVMEELGQCSLVCPLEQKKEHAGQMTLGVDTTSQAALGEGGAGQATSRENSIGQKALEEGDVVQEYRQQTGLPELEEADFDKLQEELEDAMYAFDNGQMLAALSKMEKSQYCGVLLSEKLGPVKKKIEMLDYMSALEAVSQIRSQLKMEAEREGGAAKE